MLTFKNLLGLPLLESWNRYTVFLPLSTTNNPGIIYIITINEKVREKGRPTRTGEHRIDKMVSSLGFLAVSYFPAES